MTSNLRDNIHPYKYIAKPSEFSENPQGNTLL